MAKKEQGKKEKTIKKAKVKKENYFAGVRAEMKKVSWPKKEEVIKYTVSTIIFIIVLVLFFVLMSLVMSLIKGAFN